MSKCFTAEEFIVKTKDTVHYTLNESVITLLSIGHFGSFLTRLPIAEITVQGAFAHAGGLRDLRNRAGLAVVHL